MRNILKSLIVLALFFVTQQTYAATELTVTAVRNVSTSTFSVTYEPPESQIGALVSYQVPSKSQSFASTTAYCVNSGSGLGGIWASSSITYTESFTRHTAPGDPSCQSEGIYYIVFSAGGEEYYAKYFYNGAGLVSRLTLPVPSSYDTVFSSQYNTRFTAFSNTGSTTAASVSVSYFIDPDEATTTQADKNPTHVRVRYSKVPSTDYDTVYEAIAGGVLQTGFGTSTFDLPTLTPNSTYELNIQFANAGTAITQIVPFPLAYVYVTITTNATGGIGSTSVELYNGLEEHAQEYLPCGVFDLYGCIVNAAIYLFKPPAVAFHPLYDIQDMLPTKYPFSYFYEVTDEIANYEAPTTTSDMQNYTLDLNGTFFGDTNIEILSTTTVDMFLGEDMRLWIREWIGYVMVLGFAAMVFFTIQRQF